MHISSSEVFSKILKKLSMVQKNDTSYERQGFFHWKKSKWPTKKKLIFQLRQFSIFWLVELIDAKGIGVA